MDTHKTIFEAFLKLGAFLTEFCKKYSNHGHNRFDNDLQDTLLRAKQQNGWFTEEHIVHALAQWGVLLEEKKLTEWLGQYPLKQTPSKTVAVIMAGNIPLVGFHDFLCVVLTGNRVLAKLSANDKVLLPFLAKKLIEHAPMLKQRIRFTEKRLDGFDAVIATGSNNTGRYFEHYFGKYPNIIRKNRSSVAVLTGTETKETLHLLGEDIFRYFGLGCRSVSKLFVPQDYSFDTFFEAIYPYNTVINNTKYANNYDYNKAVYLMSDFKLLDNGFLLLKEDTAMGSPIATLYIERYDTMATLEKRLVDEAEQLQCIVGDVALELPIRPLPFGSTQKPGLSAYADGVDTLDFLLGL